MRSSFNRFLIIFTSLHALIIYYIGSRSADNAVSWAILLAAAVLLWTLPVFHWRRGDEEEGTKFHQTWVQASYVSMGLLSWLLVLTVLRDLAFLATYVIDDSRLSLIERVWSGTNNFALAFGFMTIGSWIALSGPRIKNITVPVSKKELDGFKIVQITDLHVGPTIGTKYVKKVVDMVMKLKPDVTVMTGDIIDGKFNEHRRSIEPLIELTQRGRVFYALGNHEYYHRFFDHWLPEFNRIGAKVLLNSGEAVSHGGSKLWIGGITDPAAAQFTPANAPNLHKALEGGETTDFKVLLSHRPGFADAAEKTGFDLQLSGHTHGGQFFPWTIVAKFFHLYLLGLFKHGKMWVYVGPGTGTWGPPVRFGTTPELTCITLVAS